LNILLFTADDLNRDTAGCFGGKVPDLTPNVDAFAVEGLRFAHAHVNAAICQPSRGVLATGRYGQFVYRNNNEGLTMRATVEAVRTDSRAAQRVRMFRYRTFEELYDLQTDPDCLNNLVDKPDHRDDLDHMRNELHAWMQRTHDPLLPAFENRTNTKKVKAVLTNVYGENYTRAAQGAKNARRQKDGQEQAVGGAHPTADAPLGPHSETGPECALVPGIRWRTVNPRRRFPSSRAR
jgi:hypothetical protein